MKPRLLIIPESFPTDADPVAGIFIKDQIQVLSTHFEVSVFNTNPWYRGAYESMTQAQFFDFHLFNKKLPTVLKPLAYLWWERQCLKLAKKLPKPDIIHLHGASLRGRWVQKLAAFWNIPYVVTEHTGPWSAISSRPMIFNRVKDVFRSAAEVWPVSHHLKSEMAESGVEMKNVHVMANPVDSDFFTLRNTPLTDSETILFLGRLDDFKGGLRTLRAFHQAMPELPDFELCIVGFGAEANLILEYIQENKLESRVNFIEQKLSRQEMLGLFHQARMLVFPSLFESFGLVGIEAMSTGLPLVVTNKTGPRDYFDASAGVQVDPMSIDEIAQAMVHIARHPESYDATAIRRNVVENFGFGAFAKKAKVRFDGILSA